MSDTKVYYHAGDRFVEIKRISTVTESEPADTSVKYVLKDVFTTANTFTVTATITKEGKAKLLGFKSVASMNRFYRRMKRRREKERRERLKRANELH